VSEDLTSLSAGEIARRVNAKTLTAREVTAAHLARIEAHNPTLNAIFGFDAQEALTEADTIEQRLAKGEPLPLAGAPFKVKDNLWVGGRRITQGSKIFADFIAPRDAWAVARLSVWPKFYVDAK
jgi:aspartyl-tRNA(Asn)/glutamyl-tRNA(Gln) amidotransferase subunit A